MKFYKGKQLPLPMVVTSRKELLTGAIDARGEITDGKRVLVVFHDGAGLERQIADELYQRWPISVCCVDRDEYPDYCQGQGIATVPAYVFYQGGHEVSRIEGEYNFEAITIWLERTVQ